MKKFQKIKMFTQIEYDNRIEVKTFQSKTDQAPSGIVIDNESQDPTLVDSQLTRDRGRKNRISPTRISSDDFVILFSVLESFDSKPATYEKLLTIKILIFRRRL